MTFIHRSLLTVIDFLGKEHQQKHDSGPHVVIEMNEGIRSLVL